MHFTPQVNTHRDMQRVAWVLIQGATEGLSKTFSEIFSVFGGTFLTLSSTYRTTCTPNATLVRGD